MKSVLRLYVSAFANLNKNVWILAVVMLINRSGSMVLLFTSLYLTNDLKFTLAEAGFVLSIYGAGSIAGSYLGGWLADRYSHKRVMMGSLLGCGAILLLLPLATNYYVICAIILMYATAADMFRPANTASIVDYSTVENRTRSISLIRLAANLGFTLGPAIGGFIAYHIGYKPLFLMDAGTSFLAAWLVYAHLPEKEQEEDETSRKQVLADVKTSAYRDVPFLIFIVMVAIYGTCFFQFFASLPQYFNKVSHYTEDTIGLLLALNGLLVVLIEMPLMGYIGNTKRPFFYILLGTLCLPIAFAFVNWGNSLMIMAVLYTFFITVSEILAMPFMLNFVLNRPKRQRQGQYSALYSIAFGVSVIAAPALGLGLADAYGFHIMFLAFITLSLVLAIGFYYLGKKKGVAPADT